MLDFGAFQRKIQMPSHDKYLLDILFGAFHGTRVHLFEIISASQLAQDCCLVSVNLIISKLMVHEIATVKRF